MIPSDMQSIYVCGDIVDSVKLSLIFLDYFVIDLGLII